MAERKGPNIWAVTQGTFVKNDLELFETGLLADAEVKCGNRTWKVHKIILGTRSEWFKKALLGPFEEGRTGIVTITEFSEQEVDCLLRFLYSSSVDFDKVCPDTTILIALLNIWKLADFFCLDTLDTLLRRALDDTCQRIARPFLCPILRDEFSREVDGVLKDEVFPAIRALYRDDMAVVRHRMLSHMLGLVLATLHYLQSREDFQNLLRETPAFAADWAVAYFEGMCENLPDIMSIPRECHACGDDAFGIMGMVDGFEWVKNRRAVLRCSDCAYVPNLYDWEVT